MQQHPVHFTRTSDGVTIAYSTAGSGPPLVLGPSWISHLEIEMTFPHQVQFMQDLSNNGTRQIIRFDCRGNGLSDREVTDVSAKARALDFEAVVDSAGVDKVAIFAWSMGGPPAIIYAAEHPDRVSHLILYASFARAFERGREAVGRAICDLIRARWSIGAKATIELIYPGADKDVADLMAKYFVASAPAEVAARLIEESLFEVDVRDWLPRLTMPTLVLHRQQDESVDFDSGRELAALIPNAHFVPLRGNIHPPFFGDSAAIIDAVNDFLSTDTGHAHHAAHHPEPSRSEVPAGLQTILFTDMESSTSLTQQLGDARAQEFVRAHNNIVREALRNHAGSEVKHTGDGIMATFPSASGALDCAVAIQQAFAEHNESSGENIRVRLGLNAGEPVAEDRDFFGAAVQLAARVCAHAHPGQILVSNVVRELTMGKGFLFADQGTVNLRGFEDPVRLYEVPW